MSSTLLVCLLPLLLFFCLQKDLDKSHFFFSCLQLFTSFFSTKEKGGKSFGVEAGFAQWNSFCISKRRWISRCQLPACNPNLNSNWVFLFVLHKETWGNLSKGISKKASWSVISWRQVNICDVTPPVCQRLVETKT